MLDPAAVMRMSPEFEFVCDVDAAPCAGRTVATGCRCCGRPRHGTATARRCRRPLPRPSGRRLEWRRDVRSVYASAPRLPRTRGGLTIYCPAPTEKTTVAEDESGDALHSCIRSGHARSCSTCALFRSSPVAGRERQKQCDALRDRSCGGCKGIGTSEPARWSAFRCIEPSASFRGAPKARARNLITTGWEYGFRARPFGPSRNDSGEIGATSSENALAARADP